MTRTSTPAIRATGLRKSFRGAHGTPVLAVDDVDLTIMPGEIVAFLGPNGAGKTTTVDMLLGLTTPDAGTIEVYGTAPAEAVRAGRVSAVMQTGGLLNDFTVAETVRAIAALHGRPERVDVVLELARLAGIAGRRVEACSGGEQQRLKFALALLPDPDLVILDEPTTGMDVGARQQFWETMRADAAQGRTIVFATHYLAEADAFAERTVLMAGGRIVADGSAEELARQVAGDGEVRWTLGGRHFAETTPDPTTFVWDLFEQHGREVKDLEVRRASLEDTYIAMVARHRSGVRPELVEVTR